MAFPDDWSRKCAIVIDDAQVGSGGVSDFTVLLTRDNLPDEMCSPSDGNAAQSDGGDIRFSSDSAGSTRLPLKIDAFEHDSVDSAGDAEIRMHVLVPSIAGTGSGDTTIYVWYNTAGTESQPAEDEPYGGQSAWDDDHVHRWSLDEATTDTPPEYKDSVANRHLTEKETGATSVTGKRGNAFDGNGTGYAHGSWSGFPAPLAASTNPCTNTGLCYIPGDDILVCVNFDDDEVVEINKSTGAEITRFSLTDGPPLVQGVAWNSVAERYALVSGDGTDGIWLYERDGTFDQIIGAAGDAANAIAYDATDDVYWSRSSGGNLLKVSTSTGLTIATVTLTGGANVTEGITHNPNTDTLYVTSDTGAMVYEVNKSTGATIQSWPGPTEIEHPAYDPVDDALFINSDQRFHLNSGENVVYKYTTDGEQWSWKTARTEYTLEWWWKPDNITTTAVVLSHFAGVNSGSFYIEVQVRSSGIVRVYEGDITFAATASGTIAIGTWYFCQLVYDSTADTLTLYLNNSQVAQNTSAVYSARPDGSFAIGARADGTLNQNSAIDEVRFHRVARPAAWRTTRYNNENAPATFAAAGTPEDAGGGFTRIVRRGENYSPLTSGLAF